MPGGFVLWGERGWLQQGFQGCEEVVYVGVGVGGELLIISSGG